jgi:hypothetical protein
MANFWAFPLHRRGITVDVHFTDIKNAPKLRLFVDGDTDDVVCAGNTWPATISDVSAKIVVVQGSAPVRISGEQVARGDGTISADRREFVALEGGNGLDRVSHTFQSVKIGRAHV